MPNAQEIDVRENDWVTGAKRVALSPSAAKRIVDEASGTLTYQGWAAPGTATSAGTWFVEKIEVSGTATTFTHATGAWDDRASLTYL